MEELIFEDMNEDMNELNNAPRNQVKMNSEQTILLECNNQSIFMKLFSLWLNQAIKQFTNLQIS